MRLLILIIAALAVSCAEPQYTKTVRSGYASKGFQHNDNMVSLFGNRSQNGTQYGMYANHLNQSREIGVCYIEVPTASLAKDPSNVPTGNGSRPDLSTIRTCCTGYIRNIHNYLICDPVCSEDCVNSLCTAPETCTCFPEHVKNEGGFCVATCPIGCQNGRCDGGECMCKQGYRLHRDGNYCVPVCKDNCGGIGNCTAPETCTCRSGYEATQEGSCKLHCTACANGQCVGPNDCRCQSGYYKDEKGDCKARCERGCKINEICSAPNICTYPGGVSAPSGQELIITTTSAYYPQPTLQRTSNYTNPSNTQSNYHGYHHTQQPWYGNLSPLSNGSQPVPNQNPVYYVPSRPNENPFNSDNQIGRPANSTQSTNSLNQSNYPYNNQPGYPYQQNYPKPVNQSGYPDYSTPLAPLPRPSSNDQYPQNNPPPGFFFNPYGGYYQPIFPGYPSNYTGVPFNPNQPLSPGQPGYSQNGSYYQPGYNQPFPPNQSGYKPQNSTYNLSKNQTGISNQTGYPYQPDNHHHTYSYQPGYPYPQSSPNPQGYFYNPAIPNQSGYPYQPGYNQPGQHGYPNVPGQPGQPGQSGQPGAGYPNQPGQPNQQSNLNQFDYYQQPTNYNQLNSQVEYLVQPRYINMTTYMGQTTSNMPAQCSVPCTTAECVEGNRCVCNNGYVALTDGTKCKPICLGCINGICTAPNVCICNEGYHMSTAVKGRKMCVKRVRRSVDAEKKAVNVADLLVFEIPVDD